MAHPHPAQLGGAWRWAHPQFVTLPRWIYRDPLRKQKTRFNFPNNNPSVLDPLDMRQGSRLKAGTAGTSSRSVLLISTVLFCIATLWWLHQVHTISSETFEESSDNFATGSGKQNRRGTTGGRSDHWPRTSQGEESHGRRRDTFSPCDASNAASDQRACSKHACMHALAVRTGGMHASALRPHA